MANDPMICLSVVILAASSSFLFGIVVGAAYENARLHDERE